MYVNDTSIARSSVGNKFRKRIAVRGVSSWTRAQTQVSAGGSDVQIVSRRSISARETPRSLCDGSNLSEVILVSSVVVCTKARRRLPRLRSISKEQIPDST